MMRDVTTKENEAIEGNASRPRSSDVTTGGCRPVAHVTRRAKMAGHINKSEPAVNTDGFISKTQIDGEAAFLLFR